MSRNELVEAYLEGKISRRGFMRGMAATGASLTMAAAAADHLRVSAQDDGDDSGDGGGPYGPYDTPTLIPITEEVVTQVPITEEVVTQVPVTEEVVTQVPVTEEVVKATKTPVVKATEASKATEAPKSGGGTTGGGGTKGGGGATSLPDTGAGQNSRSSLMGPLSLAASAAAAAIAFRVRSFRKPAESDVE